MKKPFSYFLFITSLLFLLQQCKKDDIVFPNPGYAIGVIVFYTPQFKSGSRIDFTFSVGGKSYDNNYGNGENGWSVPASGNYTTGDKYMIQYDKGNPQTARMLFSYSVKDSTDYNNYVNQFKTNPPQ